MIHDIAAELVIPTSYCLLNGKKEHIYFNDLHEIIIPRIISVDFMYSLISQVKHEFTESKILGCYFHYKQALLRKFTKFKICMENTNAILSNVELLTILKISEVINGINYIKSLFIQDEIVEAFWNYFAQIRQKDFHPQYRI
ncbi:hypothetical protein HZS_5727 [Henneguya salminicola]|nr:hypothetical protein HZS_5727 [Henneguya salminicola]